MNLTDALGPIREVAFRVWRASTTAAPGGRFRTFGRGGGQIEGILVINLDRQPERWRRLTQEIGRFRTADGHSLMSIARRFPAIDARDGRAIASTVDVDPIYRIGDQLHVQPDERLAQSFPVDEPIRMSRQEIAVARSHIEVWKAIATGTQSRVLVLEDDAWFRPRARASIDRSWREALSRSTTAEGPDLMFLSYEDAGGTALREDEHGGVFRPVRGLWHLSGYVLSQRGAMRLLRAMPVVGPVDLWMNYRFAEMGALAMTSPAIRQRLDGRSDNAYSVMPYLARAGVVDGGHAVKRAGVLGRARVLAWSRTGERDSLAMALSMLGLRVRVFDTDDAPLDDAAVAENLRTFDALVDPRLQRSAVISVAAAESVKLLFEDEKLEPAFALGDRVPVSRIAVLGPEGSGGWGWEALCEVLAIARPVDRFPSGAAKTHQLFRYRDSQVRTALGTGERRKATAMDDSPWVLPPEGHWRPQDCSALPTQGVNSVIAASTMTAASGSFPGMTETFPGSLASFSATNLYYGEEGVQVVIETDEGGPRPFVSGAFASERSFTYGRFQADIRAAAGPGLITGFFLYRGSPRQEIDIEIAGSDPTRMLTNVFFNPGDEGSALDYGYRGAPCWIDLGFDATEDFHEYAISWSPNRIVWLVDGRPVHARDSWDPTPIPHLAMRVHGNLWAPRSLELAGRVDNRELPASAGFRNVVVSG